MKQGEHIHASGDGKGRREVFVNGKRIDQVFYADTKRGVVRVFRYPFKHDKWRKRVLTKTIHGVVEVRRSPHDVGRQ